MPLLSRVAFIWPWASAHSLAITRRSRFQASARSSFGARFQLALTLRVVRVDSTQQRASADATFQAQGLARSFVRSFVSLLASSDAQAASLQAGSQLPPAERRLSLWPTPADYHYLRSRLTRATCCPASSTAFERQLRGRPLQLCAPANITGRRLARRNIEPSRAARAKFVAAAAAAARYRWPRERVARLRERERRTMAPEQSGVGRQSGAAAMELNLGLN